MAESRVNPSNYITIQGWMITDLGLKGNELIIYACIYGFSQAEDQVFSGSLQYLADWTNSTKQGVVKCLKSLVEKGIIGKNEKTINGVKFCEYHTTKFNGVLNKVAHPMQQSLMGGIKQSLTNNIDIYNIADNIRDNIGGKPTAKNPYQLFDRLAPNYDLSPIVQAKILDWLAYKKEQHKDTYKEQGLKSLLRQCESAAREYGDKALCDVIDASMAKLYKGIIFDSLGRKKQAAKPSGGGAFIGMLGDGGGLYG